MVFGFWLVLMVPLVQFCVTRLLAISAYIGIMLQYLEGFLFFLEDIYIKLVTNNLLAGS